MDSITQMKEISRSMKPTEVIAAIDKDVGGIDGAESISSLPRDKQQIKNVKRNLFSVDNKDEFSALLTRCKVQQEGFVIRVQAAGY